MSGEKFADHQAAEIHRRDRLIKNLRNRLWKLEKSRDLWRQRALTRKGKR